MKVAFHLQSIYFKLRGMTPCCLAHLDFDIDLPEEDEIQVETVRTLNLNWKFETSANLKSMRCQQLQSTQPDGMKCRN